MLTKSSPTALANPNGTAELPPFIEPMQCQRSKPFDSDEFFFEIKWDGTRALAFIEQGGYRLINRRQNVMRERYPEFAFLSQLPAGTVLDGEVIVTKNGKPDFASLQGREHLKTPRKIEMTARVMPATFVAFDVLYVGFKSVMGEPFSARREMLHELVEPHVNGRLVVSEGVIGPGVDYYQSVIEQNLEGVVAKRLRSKYVPGQRADNWLKIKRRQNVHCVIIGYVPDGSDFRSLVLASNIDGDLRFVGKVGTGINEATRKELNRRLAESTRRLPVVPCPEKARWIEPTIYCVVSYTEQTNGGTLRDPVFEGMAEP